MIPCCPLEPSSSLSITRRERERENGDGERERDSRERGPESLTLYFLFFKARKALSFIFPVCENKQVNEINNEKTKQKTQKKQKKNKDETTKKQ